MSAQKGRDLLLKVDSTGQGSFVTVAGLRTRTISFGAETVDVTTAESTGQWRELLAGAGAKRARLSGAGIFRDQGSDAEVRRLFFDGTIVNWRVVIPEFGSIDGPFQVTALEYAGSHDREMTFDLTLESPGYLVFTAMV